MNSVYINVIKYVKYDNIPLNVCPSPQIIISTINPPIYTHIMQYSNNVFNTIHIKK